MLAKFCFESFLIAFSVFLGIISSYIFELILKNKKIKLSKKIFFLFFLFFGLLIAIMVILYLVIYLIGLVF
jgi:hypothetical protein